MGTNLVHLAIQYWLNSFLTFVYVGNLVIVVFSYHFTPIQCPFFFWILPIHLSNCPHIFLLCYLIPTLNFFTRRRFFPFDIILFISNLHLILFISVYQISSIVNCKKTKTFSFQLGFQSIFPNLSFSKPPFLVINYIFN